MGSEGLARIAFIIAVLFLLILGVWAYGIAVGKNQMRPARTVNEAIDLIRSYQKFGEFIPKGRRMLAPEGAARVRSVVYDADGAIARGQYAVLGWNDAAGHYAVWLHEADGALAHVWPLDKAQFEDQLGNSPHAMMPLPDGSILISSDTGRSMQRIDPCGKIVWTREGVFHHSFQEAPDGGVWTWHSEKNAYGQYQYAIKLNPDTGEMTHRIGLLEDIIGNSHNHRTLFSVPSDFRFVPDDENPKDLFHPNDVEELTGEMAPAFPMFVAGDLLISIRNLNMLAVIDQTGKLKWVRQGPWRHQHDPDFRPDGTIAVFNNNVGRPTSNIIVLDPATGDVANATSELSFYSKRRGKQQTLPNGNLLITIPEEGRAVEVTTQGKFALEFNNISSFDPAYNEDLVNVKWLPPGFFNTQPSCSH